MAAESKPPIKGIDSVMDPKTGELVYSLEFELWEDLEICLKVDGIEWMGKKLRVDWVKMYLSK